MKRKKSVFYINIVLSIIAILFVVNVVSPKGHDLINRAVAAVTGITGEGTLNYVARFAGAQSPSNYIGNSVIYDDGTYVGIGTTSPGMKLDTEISSGSGLQNTAFFGAGGNSNGNGASILIGSTQTTAGYISGIQTAANQGDLALGTQTAGGYSERLRILGASGNVGIGDTTPGYKLEVVGNIVNSNPSSGWIGLTGDLPGYATSLYPTLKTNYRYLFFSANGVYSGYWDGANLYSNGGSMNAAAFYYSSDERLKTNIQPVGGLSIITQLNGVKFNWKKDGSPSAGLIAQNVEAVLPEAVTTDEKTGMESINSGVLMGPLVESIKELNAKIEMQDKKIDQLEQKINELTPN